MSTKTEDIKDIVAALDLLAKYDTTPENRAAIAGMIQSIRDRVENMTVAVTQVRYDRKAL